MNTAPSRIEDATPPGPEVFVLVHGACHGGWCWDLVADLLREAGHQVLAPTLPGLAERADLLSDRLTLDDFVEDTIGQVDAAGIDRFLLVGHSFGGNVVTGIVDRIPERVRQLVYLDAGVLQDGQAAFDVIPAAVAEQRRRAAQESGSRVMPAPSPSAFGVPEDHPLAGWMAERLTDHPISTYESPLRIAGPVGNGRPVTYIACTSPAYAVLAPVREWVRAATDWSWREIQKVSADATCVAGHCTAIDDHCS
jgi:pimeloyl-ACP methyl ester carboxylesterase